jgi:hypothetical protein
VLGSRTPPGSSVVALAAVLGPLLLLVTGCGKEPVSIPTLRLSAADQAVCQRVTTALPDELGGQGRRKTQPAAALGGAWGDPPMVLQCGVGRPPGLTRTSHCAVVNDVGWFAPDAEVNDESSDVELTTVGYRPYVQLSVPAKYRGSALAEAEVQLAPIVKQYLRQVSRCR